MSQQKPDPARPKPRRAIAKSKTPPSNGSQPLEQAPVRPAPDDREGWRSYWAKQGQLWRREPEINKARQRELTKRYTTVTPNIEQGIYPFRGMKLSRADVEWLLATYQESFTDEKGLDVRGADLSRENLSKLPLRGLRGGLMAYELVGRQIPSEEHRKMAAAQINNVSFLEAQLEFAHLGEAQLGSANLVGAQLEYADLSNAYLLRANLFTAQLHSACLAHAQLTDANFVHAQLDNTNLGGAQLEGAHFNGAHLQNASLDGAQLIGADLSGARLVDADLNKAVLADSQGVGPRLVDVRWDGVNLAVVDWSQMKILGDEYRARQPEEEDPFGRVIDKLSKYQEAVRANRQLAVALQDQGLNEEASRFAYRANLCQRKVLWFQMVQPGASLWRRVRKFWAWTFSHLLNLLAGYGYRPERSFLAYLLVIFGFMGLYLLTSHFTTPHLRWDEALVLSLSSFHGRGFFTQTVTLGDAYARLAVTEAVLGLFIEISFIATFTQRFLGK